MIVANYYNYDSAVEVLIIKRIIESISTYIIIDKVHLHRELKTTFE